MRKPINTYGIEAKAVFGGEIESVDGVAVEVVKAEPSRFYIAIGQPGFNSSANNRGGYKSPAAAAACHKFNNR